MLLAFAKLLICFVITILMSAGVFAEQSSVESIDGQVLRLLGPPWEPFLYQDEPNKGLATEIVVEALTRAGYQTSIGIRPWRRVLAEASAGAADVLIGLWYSPERAKSYSFSEPYYINQITFVSVRDRHVSYTSLRDLEKLRIGVRKGASFGEAFDGADYLKKVSTLNSLTMLRMLSLGRIDLGIGDRLILNRIIQKDKTLANQLSFVDPVYIERPLHMAVSKALPSHQKVVDDFNRELLTMKSDGILNRIITNFR